MPQLYPSKEEPLEAFARYLDDARDESSPLFLYIRQFGRRGDELHRYVDQANQLLQEHSKQEILAEVKSYAGPERSFERDALEAFFGFLQIQKATR